MRLKLTFFKIFFNKLYLFSVINNLSSIGFAGVFTNVYKNVKYFYAYVFFIHKVLHIC